MTTDASEHVAANRVAWDAWAANYAEGGARNWAATEPSWGIFDVPESQLGVLPPDLAGKDTVELGCGTAYVSAWLARRGANVVGIDNSPKQLETARRLQAAHGLMFPLHLGDAERTPFPDASFDFAISEYGASIWCDPQRWIPEAARILRPDGELVFLVNGTLMMLCTPDDPARIDDPVSDRLERPYFGMKRFAWPDGSVEFHLGYGDWIRLLRRCGFDVEDLIEIQPSTAASTRYPFVTLDWARRWPCEEVWKARRR